MAEPKKEETVSVPVSVLQELQDRLARLENVNAVRSEAEHKPVKILDDAYEAWKREASRPAKERSQDVANKRYGTQGKRFRVRIDSSNEGKPGPNVSEHPELVISANSDLEARGRWEELCGIRKHDYRIVCVPA